MILRISRQSCSVAIEAVDAVERMAVAVGDMALHTIDSADAKLTRLHQEIWAMYSHAKCHYEELCALRARFDFCDLDQGLRGVKERLDQMIAKAQYDMETCYLRLRSFDEYYHAKSIIFNDWRDELEVLRGQVMGLSQSVGGNLVEAQGLIASLNCI